MLKLILVVSAFIVVAFSEEAGEPLSRERRYSPSGQVHSQNMGQNMQQPFQQMQNSFQQNQYNWNGFFQNMRTSMQNMFDQMQNSFRQFVPWYRGPNVCVDEQFQPDPVVQQLYPQEFGANAHTETCQGNNFKYICVASVVNNGKAQQRVRKYECCTGFVRAAEGPGCVPGYQ